MTRFIPCGLLFYLLVIFQNSYAFPAPAGVAPKTIAEGEVILKNKIAEIRDYFKKRPQDTALNIYQTPIDKILKLEHNGTQYYAVYDYVLGKGTYTRVLLGKNIYTNQWVAIKEKPFARKDDLEHEINQLSLLGNYCGHTVYNNRTNKYHYLFMKLQEGIPFEKFYEKNIKPQTTEINNIILSSFYALEKLHQKNILHNDIHEGNLMFDTKNKSAVWVDLAFSIKLNPAEQFIYLEEPPPNTPYCYNAPESNTVRGYMTDVYQLGFTALRMLLILSENNPDIKRKHLNSRAYSCKAIKTKKQELQATYPILLRMIDADMKKRPTLQEAIQALEKNHSAISNPRILTAPS